MGAKGEYDQVAGQSRGGKGKVETLGKGNDEDLEKGEGATFKKGKGKGKHDDEQDDDWCFMPVSWKPGGLWARRSQKGTYGKWVKGADKDGWHWEGNGKGEGRQGNNWQIPPVPSSPCGGWVRMVAGDLARCAGEWCTGRRQPDI